MANLKYKHTAYTSAQWASLNPVIVENEIVIESDTKRTKIGNGVSTYNQLEYADANSIGNSLGSIKPTDAAPTPQRNGNYTFSIGGNKPAWLTAEAGITEVKAGDGVAVVYTAPSSYTYTHVDVSSAFVTMQKLTELTGAFFSISGFINTAGDFYANNSRYCTDYLRVTNQRDIILFGESNNEYVNVISFYDIDKVYISGISNNQTTVTEQTVLAANIPTNAAFVRVSTITNYLDKSFVNFGNYNDLLKAVETRLVSLNAVTGVKLDGKLDKKIGKNLLNPYDPDIIIGKFLQVSRISTNAEYSISGYINVTGLSNVAINFDLSGAYAVFYDINKNYITSFGRGTTFAVPNNAVYLRVSGRSIDQTGRQVESGIFSTAFEEYTEYQPLGYVKSQVPSREVATILPAKMYFVKGKQSCIYYENVLFKNLDDPTTLYFDKGINYNRQVTFKFSASATAQTMNAKIIRNFKKGLLKAITYDVIDPAVNNGKTINVLHIGDSFTDIGTWVKECKTLLNAQGVTYNLIGTCGNSTFKAEGLSGGNLGNTFLNNSAGVARIVQVTGMTTLPSTGYPGQTYRDDNNNIWTIRGGKIDGSGNGYIRVTKYEAVEAVFATFPTSGALIKTSSGEGDATINYSNPISAYFNPFINHSTGLLDFTNYINFWGFSTPNVVAIQFTWNDLGDWATDTTINSLVASFKTAADHIHAAYPNAKVIYSIEPMGSPNGNRDWNGKKYSVLRFTESMLAQFEANANYNTWVKIAPSFAFVDLVNGYSGGATVTPCERYTGITETSGGDGVHPNAGMLQIADCVSQVISAII